MTNLDSLLSRPANQFKAPPTYPAGNYYGTITKYEQTKSPKKGTNQLDYTIHLHTAGADVEWGEEGPLEVNKDLKKTFFLTEEAIFRLTDFLAAVGLDVERALIELIPEVVGMEVQVFISRRSYEKDNKTIWVNDVGDIMLAA